MGRFQSRDDAFQSTHELKGIQRLRIGDGSIFRPSNLAQVTVLRADTRVIKTGTDGMGFLHLTVLVLQEKTHRPVQHTNPTFRNGGCVATGGHAVTCGFHTDQPHIRAFNEGMEQTHRIRSSADAGHQHIRKPSERFPALLPRFLTDHSVKVAYQHRIGMRTCH